LAHRPLHASADKRHLGQITKQKNALLRMVLVQGRLPGRASCVQTRNGVDTLIVPEWFMVLGVGDAPEQGGWGLAAEAVAVMRALMVVEAQECVEAPLQSRPTGEVAPAEGHAPVLTGTTEPPEYQRFLADSDLPVLHTPFDVSELCRFIHRLL